MSKENDSIRISKQQSNTTRDGGTNKLWLTTAGVLEETYITLKMTIKKEKSFSIVLIFMKVLFLLLVY